MIWYVVIFFWNGYQVRSRVIPGLVGESDGIEGVITIAPPCHYNTIYPPQYNPPRYYLPQYYTPQYDTPQYYTPQCYPLSTIHHTTNHYTVKPPYHQTPNQGSLIHKSRYPIFFFVIPIFIILSSLPLLTPPPLSLLLFTRS